MKKGGQNGFLRAQYFEFISSTREERWTFNSVDRNLNQARQFLDGFLTLRYEASIERNSAAAYSQCDEMIQRCKHKIDQLLDSRNKLRQRKANLLTQRDNLEREVNNTQNYLKEMYARLRRGKGNNFNLIEKIDRIESKHRRLKEKLIQVDSHLFGIDE